MNLKPIINKLGKSLNWTTDKRPFTKKQCKALSVAFRETLKALSLLEKLRLSQKTR